MHLYHPRPRPLVQALSFIPHLCNQPRSIPVSEHTQPQRNPP